MEHKNYKRGFWPKERCIDETIKYSSRKMFQKGGGGAYAAAIDNGWLDEICNHMRRPAPSNYYWTKERYKEEARKNKTMSQFRNNCSSAFTIAWRKRWFDDINDKIKED